LVGRSRFAAEKTIDAYSRAIRRVRDYFDCCPDKLKPEQLEQYPLDKIVVRSSHNLVR